MKRGKSKKLSGRNFALTIILGVFVSIMVIILFNLIVSYAYPAPDYEDFCLNEDFIRPYPVKYGAINDGCGNCTFSKELQILVDECSNECGIPVYEYDDLGCTSELKECNLCQKNYQDASESYNRKTFFVFAIIGFILIVLGLFFKELLLQIITLPAGAFLVIEAAAKNFDDKLFVIIVFTLLIVAAVYLALKRLK
jgi:hypothetical protein